MRVLGRGQKVFDAAPVRGQLRSFETVDDVLEVLDGDPSTVVALVRDAGATFLGPLLGELAAVVCTGGTLRSHIGIVTRDHRVPCVMACVFDRPPPDGQVVEVDCSGSVGVVRG